MFLRFFWYVLGFVLAMVALVTKLGLMGNQVPILGIPELIAEVYFGAIMIWTGWISLATHLNYVLGGKKNSLDYQRSTRQFASGTLTFFVALFLYGAIRKIFHG